MEDATRVNDSRVAALMNGIHTHQSHVYTNLKPLSQDTCNKRRTSTNNMDSSAHFTTRESKRVTGGENTQKQVNTHFRFFSIGAKIQTSSMP